MDLDEVLNCIDDVVLIISKKGHIIKSNAQCKAKTISPHLGPHLKKLVTGNNYFDVLAEEPATTYGNIVQIQEGISKVIKGVRQKYKEKLILDSSEDSEAYWMVSAKPLSNDRIIITHHEVNEIKQEENFLLGGENTYRSLVLALNEGIVMHDSQGSITACNRSAEQILGLSKGQILGRSFLDPGWGTIYENGTAFPGAKHPAMVTLKTGKPLKNVVMGLQKPNGVLTWISINSQPIYKDSKNKVSGVVTSFSDITINKYVEDQLNDSLEELSNLKNVIYESAVISVTDLEGRILDVNDAFCESAQYARAELIGEYQNKVKSGYHSEDFYHEMWAKISSGKIWRGEIKNKAKDGSPYWLDAVIAPMTNAKGELYQYLLIGYLITDKKRYEERVEQSEELYKRLVERFTLATKHSNIGLWEYQYQTDKLFMDDSLLQLYELDKKTVKNDRSVLKEMISEDDREVIDEIIKYAAEHLSSFEYTFKVKLGDGNTKYINSLGRAYYDENKNLILVGLDRDVTNELLNEKKIRESLAEKESLLREIHHRVKNNLQLISSILAIKSYEIDDPEAVKVFEECINRVRSMANIHEKLYQNELTSKINIRPFFEELIKELEVSYLSFYGKVKIECSIDPVDISIDKALALGLILNELVSNAFKHGYSGSENKVIIKLNVDGNDSNALYVINEGKKIPHDIFKNTKGMMGIMLINTFVNQINGKISAKHDQGYNIITLNFS